MPLSNSIRFAFSSNRRIVCLHFSSQSFLKTKFYACDLVALPLRLPVKWQYLLVLDTKSITTEKAWRFPKLLLGGAFFILAVHAVVFVAHMRGDGSGSFASFHRNVLVVFCHLIVNLWLFFSLRCAILWHLQPLLDVEWWVSDDKKRKKTTSRKEKTRAGGRGVGVRPSVRSLIFLRASSPFALSFSWRAAAGKLAHCRHLSFYLQLTPGWNCSPSQGCDCQ